jgi:hypothetical protein
MTAPLRHQVDRATVVAVGGLLAIAGYFWVLARAVDTWTYDRWMVLILVPVLVFAGVVIIRIVTRNDTHPLTTVMIVGLLAKLGATFVRYFVTFEIYGAGDSTKYDVNGAAIANAFHDGESSVIELLSFRPQTQFIDDLTGLVYTCSALRGHCEPSKARLLMNETRYEVRVDAVVRARFDDEPRERIVRYRWYTRRGTRRLG